MSAESSTPDEISAVGGDPVSVGTRASESASRRRQLRGQSLRAKIVAWFFLPTALILLAVALVSFFAYQQVTRVLIVEREPTNSCDFRQVSLPPR